MAKLRPVAPEDAAAVGRLLQRTNMGSSDASARQDLWQNYPFAREFPDVPAGWVLVDDNGQIVGNIDNVRVLYRLGDTLIRAAVAASWVVEPSARSQSLQLIATFLKQTNIDLPLVVSASPTTAQVMTAMKILRIPIPDYAVPFFWPLRYHAFAAAALKRKALPAAQVAAWPAGWAMCARDAYYGIHRELPSTKVRRLNDFDDRFEKLWPVSSQTKRLRAVRNRAVIEWRFRNEFRSNRASIVAAEEGPRLRGYAVLIRRGTSDLGMDLWDLADLQVENDDPSLVRDLLLGSMRIAREHGAEALKFMTGVPTKRAAAEALHPYSYRLSLWQLYYKPATPELKSVLSAPDAWDFSPFDTF